jgi:geranylgeranyl pyrophosphate synthase
MDARAYLEERAALLEPFLEAALPAADAPPARLHAAMRHLVFPGGKRLRPGFAFAACEAVGAPPERALPLAAAVELIHSYSLVHDDLPCMDDDVERRGRPTVHVAFDEATAVLAGDALQACAFEVLAGAGAVEPARVAAALSLLARTAGASALVGGQWDDLFFRAGGPDETVRVEAVHRRKSAALIAASAAGGATLGGAGTEQVARLLRFGETVGVAFQIADDLLDEGDGEACSLPRVIGSEAARARAEALLEAGLEEISDLGERGERLRELARYAVRRTR